MQRFAGDKAVILMASSTGTPAGRGFGVGSSGSFRVACNRLLYQVIEVFTKTRACSTPITSYTFLLREKKYSCDTFL